ncbi:DUF4365 domain-containing protein [Nocardia camponoti]|uniref:DUF4365 domain-containing protein n=1 Tax=Nocardia camponoti TaxID=1616106 RepID=A0A917QH71_9NOCA|nr:DUF4365 domain-containing protein [Nocardia camponoti]GGK51108.1 hypothetical protein GCM10011591_23350 [Nocardia camponoti]
MLDPNIHQGKFGEDYIRVLASAAGLVWSADDVDVDGVDLTIKQPGRTPKGFSPQIEVQVKTMSRPTFDGGVVVFRGLNRTQFNQLAGDDFAVPRYLFAIHVPPRSGQFADSVSGATMLRHCGYFVSLRDQPRVPESDTRRKVPVRIPLSNVLDVEALRALVIGSSK